MRAVFGSRSFYRSALRMVGAHTETPLIFNANAYRRANPTSFSAFVVPRRFLRFPRAAFCVSFFFSLSWRSVSLNLLPPGATPRFLPALGSNCEMRRPYRIILFFCASRSSTFGGRGRGESAWEEPSPREQGSSRYAPGSRLKRKKTKRNEQTIKQSN